MNKVVLYIFLVLLSGCENLKKSLGLAKDTPDEFLINKTDPIERPPNYELLPPDTKSSAKSKKNSNSIKNIFDENLKKNNNSTKKNTQERSSKIEEEILKKIK